MKGFLKHMRDSPQSGIRGSLTVGSWTSGLPSASLAKQYFFLLLTLAKIFVYKGVCPFLSFCLKWSYYFIRLSFSKNNSLNRLKNWSLELPPGLWVSHTNGMGLQIASLGTKIPVISWCWTTPKTTLWLIKMYNMVGEGKGQGLCCLDRALVGPYWFPVTQKAPLLLSFSWLLSNRKAAAVPCLDIVIAEHRPVA